MNADFKIDESCFKGIGLVEIEKDIKLLKHYEIKLETYRIYTLDIYENGLIKCYNHLLLNGGRYGDIRDESIPPMENIIINITNGEKIDNLILELLDNIYKPFCIILLGTYGSIGGHISEYEYKNIQNRVKFFEETFQQLYLLKKLHSKMIIF